MKNNGELVDKDTINEITTNMFVTPHATKRLLERTHIRAIINNKVDYKVIKQSVVEMVNANILAYYNTDGSINIAVNKWEYLVFAYDEYHKNYSLITYKVKSKQNVDIYEKRRMAQKGIGRRV